RKAKEIYESLDFDDSIELINLQKGIIKKNKKEYDEAILIFENVVANIDKENLYETKIEALFHLGEIAFERENFALANSYFIKAYKLFDAMSNNIGLQKRILKSLITTNKKLKQYDAAQEYSDAYIQISDSLGNFLNKNMFESMYDKILFDKQLITIEQLDKEKKIQQKNLRFSKLISILSIALISILSLLSYSLFKNNKIRINTNILLQEKNRELIKEKEKVEQASKARSEFLATVSHELRTPLNAINGITYLLLQENPKKEQLEYLKSLEFSGNYLLNFINDILEINRLESDKIQIEKMNINIHELVENISNSFNEFISANKVTFSKKVAPTIHNYIISDSIKLSQILINLINNAVKFSKNGNVWLTIDQVEETTNTVTLFFEVKDNGIGIPEEKQLAIFESFSQGSVEINRTYGGTGLGLSIVKKLLELFNSEIKLTSKANLGTSFSFVIEFEKGALLSEAIPVEIIDNSNVFKKLEGRNILLVEDNKINQMITKRMLENSKVTCHVIDNGEEAIAYLKSNTYDLVLMDVHLPGINGTEATEIIRNFDPKTPIIALTAISLNENRELLLSFGMNDVITKPFIPDDFYKTISQNLP
nr:ATP-binding protein [Flavobacterium sp.]